MFSAYKEGARVFAQKHLLGLSLFIDYLHAIRTRASCPCLFWTVGPFDPNRSFNLSFIVFFLFDRIWAKSSANYHEIFLGYAVICFLALLITIFLWPDQPFTYEEQILEEVGLLDRTISKEIGAIRAPSVFKHASIGRPAYQPAPSRMPATPERRNNAPKSEKSGEWVSAR